MIEYLDFNDILELHAAIVSESGGNAGILNRGMIESAAAAPRTTLFGTEAYPTLVDKAAALCFSLVCNHGFADGNKRIGHKAMETMLVINGFEIEASIDEQEATILKLAAGELDRETFTEWVRSIVVSLDQV